MLTGLHPTATGIMDSDHRLKVPILPQLLPAEYTKRIGFVENANICPDMLDDGALLTASRRTKIHPNLWTSFGWSAGWTSYEMVPDGHERTAEFIRSSARSPEPWLVFYHTNLMHDAGSDYFQQIETLDRFVGTVLESVDFDTTVVLLTSDHGEGFRDDLNRTHHGGRMHQDLLHVPLLLWLPPYLERLFVTEYTRLYEAHSAQLEANVRRISTPASGIDLVPTLLQLAGFVRPSPTSASLMSASGSSLRSSAASVHFRGASLLALPPNRRVYSVDTAYCYWPGESTRSFTTAGATWRHGGTRAFSINVIADMLYPLKRTLYERDKARIDLVHNLAYDPAELHDLSDLHESVPHAGGFLFVVSGLRPGIPWPLLHSPVISALPHRDGSVPPVLVLPEAPRDLAGTLSLVHLAMVQLFDGDTAAAERHLARTIMVLVRPSAFLPPGWMLRFRNLLESFELDQSTTPLGWDLLTFAGVSAHVTDERADTPGIGARVVGRWNDLDGYHYFHHEPGSTQQPPTFAPEHPPLTFEPTRVACIPDGGWMAVRLAAVNGSLPLLGSLLPKRRQPTLRGLSTLRLPILDVDPSLRALAVDNHLFLDVTVI